MARVNISLPNALYAEARAAGLNVSEVTRHALARELDRRAKNAALNAYLADLEQELGPISVEERAAARAWADRAFGTVGERPKTA